MCVSGLRKVFKPASVTRYQQVDLTVEILLVKEHKSTKSLVEYPFQTRSPAMKKENEFGHGSLGTRSDLIGWNFLAAWEIHCLDMF